MEQPPASPDDRELPLAPQGPRDEDAIVCPWCGWDEVERVSEFGPQLMTAQYMCLACHSPFERIRKRGPEAGDEPGSG